MIITRETVQKIALETQFTLRKQESGLLDLNAYVYVFAAQIITLTQQSPEPLCIGDVRQLAITSGFKQKKGIYGCDVALYVYLFAAGLARAARLASPIDPDTITHTRPTTAFPHLRENESLIEYATRLESELNTSQVHRSTAIDIHVLEQVHYAMLAAPSLIDEAESCLNENTDPVEGALLFQAFSSLKQKYVIPSLPTKEITPWHEYQIDLKDSLIKHYGTLTLSNIVRHKTISYLIDALKTDLINDAGEPDPLQTKKETMFIQLIEPRLKAMLTAA